MKIPFLRVMMCMMMLGGFMVETVVAVGVPVGAPAAEAAAPAAEAAAPAAEAAAPAAEAAGPASECCNVMELVPCANAFTSSTPPSAECCERLKEQQAACICEYITDPALGGLINTPNAKMVSDSCGSPMPNNC